LQSQFYIDNTLRTFRLTNYFNKGKDH
jgi:hypothetical protein